MGYNTHIVVGHLSKNPLPEYVKDKNKPYADGSGFEVLKDEKGNKVFTGEVRSYFDPYVEMDMSKIYDSHLSLLHNRYKETPMLKENEFVDLYMKDGNTSFREDVYGNPLIAIPFLEVLKAARKDAKENGYRRYKWIKDLLESMQGSEDMENELTCLFYGS